MSSKKNEYKNLPLLPVRDIVVFPHSYVQLAVGRRKSVNALEKAENSSGKLIISAQKDIYVENPVKEDIYDVGIIVEIRDKLELSDGTYKVLIGGKDRVILNNIKDNGTFLEADIVIPPIFSEDEKEKELQTIKSAVLDLFKDYVKLESSLEQTAIVPISQIENAGELADVIISSLGLEKKKAQQLLEEFNPVKRLEKLAVILKKEINVQKIKEDLRTQINSDNRRSDKKEDDNIIKQVKAMKKEFMGDQKNNEGTEYEKRIKNSNMSEQAKKAGLKEAERLKKMMPYSPQASVVRTYLDWLLKLPWEKTTPDENDLKKSADILESEHYGLKDAKDMILEHLAVTKLSNELKTPILCFVGPPGTGKTSFGKAVAQAMGRKFTRVSLGGIRDEAEIRGHRRTYIGALPGRIIQSLSKTESRNPVFILDEVDKMGKDFRGDPASALLEALDPEQNTHFSDHYLEVDFDLSDVMFITTANTTSTIPPTLLDRMEVIKFPGYTVNEKLNIAKKFLIPKQQKKAGLSDYRINFIDKAIKIIINKYTQEAGVRNVEREIGKVMRKLAREVAEGKRKTAKLTENNIEDFLGVPKFTYPHKRKNDVGIATGLSWTQNGGDTISIEVSLMPGDGKLKLTGKLGDVMKESAQTAVSYVRANADKLEVPSDFYKDKDIHIHVPAGAIPKEGPSAGITISTALVSVLSKIPVKKDVAMTGEITLSGKVLGIGGFKEKMLAAHRSGYKKVIFPHDNKKNIAEIPARVKKDLELLPVKNFNEVKNIVF
ncbi:MAG: endopeptidase La [Elusimicrobiota bacterium]